MKVVFLFELERGEWLHQTIIATNYSENNRFNFRNLNNLFFIYFFCTRIQNFYFLILIKRKKHV